MAWQRRIGRRSFFLGSAGMVSAGIGAKGILAGPVEAGEQRLADVANQVGPIPRRKWPVSGRKITVLLGCSDWPDDVILAAMRCGVNYWHKAQYWDQDKRPKVVAAILKEREAHYCQVVVDRVRGNHEAGVIDEEEHYQFVKKSLEKTGLRYFDDMIFHFGYHTVAEYQSNKAFIRAFERLRKEKLVRHLALSQHNYNGNPKVPGGQSAAEILTALMADGVYEHAQFFYSYADTEAINTFVDQAKQKGFGTIGMKTSRGASRMLRDEAFMKRFPAGTTPHHALARWLTTETKLDGAVIALRNLDEFVDTYSGAGKPIRAVDKAALEQLRVFADREVCRLCNECQPHCPQQVPVADILRYERYALDYGQLNTARELYARLQKRAPDCNECGLCLAHCTQGLPIPAKLSEAHRLLS